ncbi:MAG: GatB/YqeY domain-containing protein [Myxococcota bacterium]
MELRTRLKEDLKTAMRAKDTVARDTIRMLKADLDKAELDKGSDLDEGEVLTVLARAVKTRKESAAQYEEGGREDLRDQELAQVAVVQRYLPEAMSEDEAREAIKTIAAELSIESKKDMGRLIKETLARHRGQLDGKLASKIAGQILN